MIGSLEAFAGCKKYVDPSISGQGVRQNKDLQLWLQSVVEKVADLPWKSIIKKSNIATFPLPLHRTISASEVLPGVKFFFKLPDSLCEEIHTFWRLFIYPG